MNNLLIGALLLLTGSAQAQMPQKLNEAQMQELMEKMGKMQQCMENIQQTEMKAFEKRARDMETQLKQLCARNERQKAQSVAMKFGMEMSQSPLMLKMRECRRHMPAMMEMPEFIDHEKMDKNVCDSLD